MPAPKVSTEHLRLRGSPLARSRLKSERIAKLRQPIKKKKPFEMSDAEIKRICKTCISGYNPWDDAGDCEFDVDAARHAVAFFPEQLVHVKGKKGGEQFWLENWEVAIVGNLFGWKRPDGTRRYRHAFIFVPRKNGKTPLSAGIILYFLMEDDEPGAEIYGAASEYKQACLVFDHAQGMVSRNPALRERCKLYKGQAKAIQLVEHELNIDNLSTYRPISSEVGTHHGFNTHLGVVDELHTLPNADLVDTLETSTAARAQPLLVYITTSDYDREGSICNEKHDYACKVRDGVIEDWAFMPVIFEASRDDDWTDERVWEKANPNLDVSVSRDHLRRECQKAQENPRYENIFKRLHLNIRTEQDVRFLQMAKWDACDGVVTDNELLGQRCYGGLDLASTIDIAAFVLFFPDCYNAIVPYFWVPGDNAKKREIKDKVFYSTWAREGLIELTQGNVIDYDVVRKRIKEIGKLYDIQEIAIDRWNSTQLQTQLAGDGFEINQFGQGFASLSAPTKELERLVLEGNLKHGGNKVLRWMASNVMAEQDSAGNLKPCKKRSTEKIDGIVSLIMALGRSMVHEDKTSIYETQGLVTL